MTTAESILSQQVLRYKQYTAVRLGQQVCEVDFVRNTAAAGPHSEEEDLELLLFPSSEEDDHAPDQVVMDNEQAAATGSHTSPLGDGGPTSSTDRSFPPIPRFTRTRTVSWDKKEVESPSFTFRCSCCQFQRIGIPCVHIYSVAKKLDPEWKGFTHHHVAVRWWTSYICYGFREENTTSPITCALNALAKCDIEGPSIHLRTLLPESNIPPGISDSRLNSAPVPAFCRVNNYPQEELYQIFGGGSNKNNKKKKNEEDLSDIGFTQTSFDPDKTSEGSDYSSAGNPDDNDSDKSHQECNTSSSEDNYDGHDHAGDGGGCKKNLFQEESIGQADEEDKDKEFDGAMRAVTSLYRMAGKSDRDLAFATIAGLRSQLQGAVAKKRKKGTGTQGIVIESHPKQSRRAYNTHHQYYR